MRRILPLTAALTFALASLGAPAQEARLPDIGSSAGELLTPAQQEQYGGMMLAQLRHYDYILEDPLVESWLDALGTRLGASSDNTRQPFTFFMMRQREINAFATLGGYIGVNAGLVLAADREDEVAGVLAHEIAHVTQDHVLRAVERAQKDQLPILLAMLGAIVVAQSAGGNSADEAAQAAMVSAMGLMQQRQIDYTRSNEHEADRLGIQSLARTGYDPVAIADFFGKLQQRSRANGANYYGTEAPEFLMTHPVTTTRISEAKDRARLIAGQPQAALAASGPSNHPLLPQGLQIRDAALNAGGTGRFGFARERLRVLTASTPREAVQEYERLAKSGKLDAAQRYGMAIARLRASEPAVAADLLQGLLADRPGDEWLELGLAEALAKAGRHTQADARFDALIGRFPNDRAIALTYARALAERNSPEAGRRAQGLLRPLLPRSADDPAFHQAFARASEIAGDPVRAGEAYAEAAYLGGRPERALVQLNTLKKRPGLDYYARARIESRIAAITPVVLELRRQGVRDEALQRR